MKNFTRLPTVLAFALVAFALASTSAAAQSKEAFTQDRFEWLQAENALILIDVFADWCPTCALQQEVRAQFREEHPEVPMHTLTVNFDDQAGARRDLPGGSRGALASGATSLARSRGGTGTTARPQLFRVHPILRPGPGSVGRMSPLPRPSCAAIGEDPCVRDPRTQATTSRTRGAPPSRLPVPRSN